MGLFATAGITERQRKGLPRWPAHRLGDFAVAVLHEEPNGVQPVAVLLALGGDLGRLVKQLVALHDEPSAFSEGKGLPARPDFLTCHFLLVSPYAAVLTMTSFHRRHAWHFFTIAMPVLVLACSPLISSTRTTSSAKTVTRGFPQD